MLSRRLLTISSLLRLMLISTAAHAGSTITDKSYWPSEARQSEQNPPGSSQSDSDSALAYDRSVPNLQPATNTNDGASTWRYEGGPKPR
jgi:hypothetical protein